MSMRLLVMAIALVAACNGKKPVGPTNGGSGSGSAPPPRPPATEIEKRRDAACEALWPKLFQCAVDEAKAQLSPEEYAKLKPEELRGAHKRDWYSKCKGKDMSSRQVRVLEVCFREEKECGPLGDCLLNLEPKKPNPEPKQPDS